MEDVLFVLDHFDPEYLYCVKSGDLNKVSKIVDKYGYHSEGGSLDTRLVSVEWNDESIYINSVEGDDLSSAKEKDLVKIQAQLDEQKENIAKDGYIYIESNIFGGANEWNDAKPTDKAQKYLDQFIEMMDDSYVDGDSGYAFSLVDLVSGETLVGNGGVIFVTVDEFLSRFEEE